MHLFHLIILLNPVFNCSNKLLSSWGDKVTIGKYNFVSVILKVEYIGAFFAGLASLSPCAETRACVILSIKTDFLDRVKIKLLKSKSCLNVLMIQQF